MKPRGSRQRSRGDPDPIGHARTLVRSFGFDAARQLAESYREGYPGSSYWTAVQQNIERMQRGTGRADERL